MSETARRHWLMGTPLWERVRLHLDIFMLFLYCSRGRVHSSVYCLEGTEAKV